MGFCGLLLVGVICFDEVVVADVVGEVVEEEALGAGDAALVVVVGPWGDDEETALGTGVELAAGGLLHGSETVFDEDDDGETGLEGVSHDFFLAWTDAWGDEYGAVAGEG